MLGGHNLVTFLITRKLFKASSVKPLYLTNARGETHFFSVSARKLRRGNICCLNLLRVKALLEEMKKSLQFESLEKAKLVVDFGHRLCFFFLYVCLVWGGSCTHFRLEDSHTGLPRMTDNKGHACVPFKILSFLPLWPPFG